MSSWKEQVGKKSLLVCNFHQFYLYNVAIFVSTVKTIDCKHDTMYVLKKRKNVYHNIIYVIKNHDIVHQAYCPTLLSSFSYSESSSHIFLRKIKKVCDTQTWLITENNCCMSSTVWAVPLGGSAGPLWWHSVWCRPDSRKYVMAAGVWPPWQWTAQSTAFGGAQLHRPAHWV